MEAKRVYKGTDADMLSQIMRCLSFFKSHLADFTAYDPHFDAAYLANWRNALDNDVARYYDMDKAEVFEENLLLKDTGKELKKCYAKYRDVKYFAGKAFPDNKEALREFGEGSYSKVRNSHLRMVQFMEKLHGVATKYKTELIAQNYTQAGIDEIATITNLLRESNQKQQLKKIERPTETRKRIEAFNAFYGFGQKVSEAAKEIYRENSVLRNEFLLAKRHHPKTSKAWLNIGAGSTRKVTIAKLLKKNKLTLTNQSKETISYWQANNINDTPTEKHFLSAGEIVEITAEEPVNKFLVMQNTSAKTVRVMLTKEKKG